MDPAGFEPPSNKLSGLGTIVWSEGMGSLRSQWLGCWVTPWRSVDWHEAGFRKERSTQPTFFSLQSKDAYLGYRRR